MSAILYSRISKLPNNGCVNNNMSLESQDYSNMKFIKDHNIKTFKSLKEVGSSYLKKQNDLINILKNCKNKTLVVYEASRLSRNVRNFKEIYDICYKQKHDIAIVNMNTIFKHDVKSNFEILLKMIEKSENESREIGQRISRTLKYKKSMELPWGSNEIEKNITKLIQLLGGTNSSVKRIKELIQKVGNIEGKEEFAIVEYSSGYIGYDREIKDFLPYPMTTKEIIAVLNEYEIKKRNSKFKASDICEIVNDDNLGLDELRIDNNSSVSTSIPNEKWICLYYDPNIGLPPNITLPEKFILPDEPMMLYIPRL
jgi:DNA invertase Pin-like site-specific DNA recombinase